MIPKWFGWPLWLMAVAASGAFFLRGYPELGERVATTFGADGEVTGSMTRSGYRLFYFGMLAFLNAMFVGLGVIAVRWLPFSTLSLPNKEYWSGHPVEARDRIGRGMLVFAAGVNLMLALSHLLILQKNGVETGWPVLSMGLFLGLVFGGLLLLFVQLLLGFSRRSEG